MSDRFRWGILGTGNIAKQFARDVESLPGHDVASVASRSAERAADFCKEFGGDAADSYSALLDDVGLDGLYISLPNTLHAEWTMRALRCGHNVLCEKPLSTNLAEAEKMFAAAAKARKLLVEAFMYRCHPQTKAVVAAVRDGRIGRLTSVRASFCYRTNTISGNIRFDPELAGGALMDVGCYCLDAAMLLADSPITSATAIHRKHDRGVDVMTSGLLGFENGVQASFTCGMDTAADNALRVCGTDGFLTVAVPWKPVANAGYTLSRGTPPKQDLAKGETPVTPPPEFVETPASLPLYALEARAFAACVRGEAESFMPAADSLRLAKLLDHLRD